MRTETSVDAMCSKLRGPLQIVRLTIALCASTLEIAEPISRTSIADVCAKGVPGTLVVIAPTVFYAACPI